jgi:23S rRNA (uracil1939-C5)-methyltransferase
MADAESLEIVRIGRRGDGVAETAEGPVFVPFALPGERWCGGGDAPLERMSDSPERRLPLCRHFGSCGGCAAQHMPERLYADWKHGIVIRAFAHRGLDVMVEPIRRVPPGSRRRAVLGVKRKGTRIALGFREAGQHTLVDIGECPVLDPAIVGVFAALREMALLCDPPGTGGRLLVTRCDNGLDVAFETGRSDVAPGTRAGLARLARAARLARLTVDGDVIAMFETPRLTFGGVAVEPPPGVFVQAVPAAEQILTELVLAAVGEARPVADLFCGVGTFTFPLARRARVAAFDGDRRAIAVVQAAARGAQGLKPVAVRVRDLFREPLSRKELETFEAVVLDPPRAGAAAQAEALARSRVPLVVAVSCDPASLARDARLLLDGGYRLERVAPVDQFVFSPHVEAVAVFRR